MMHFTLDWLGHTTSKIKYMLSRLSCLNCSVGVFVVVVVDDGDDDDDDV